MKSSKISTLAMFALVASMFSFHSLSAQENKPLFALTEKNEAALFANPDNAQPAVNENSDHPAFHFDYSAGQQTARFDNLEAYVAAYLNYPAQAEANYIEGTVKVLAVISPEGKVLKADVVESLGYGCDEAALKMVINMPNWTPAMNYGIPVKGKRMLEIDFRLW